jgi:hypothetical protein
VRDVSRRQAHWHEWICTNTKGPIKCEHNKQGNRLFFAFLPFKARIPAATVLA